MVVVKVTSCNDYIISCIRFQIEKQYGGSIRYINSIVGWTDEANIKQI